MSVYYIKTKFRVIWNYGVILFCQVLWTE